MDIMRKSTVSMKLFLSIALLLAFGSSQARASAAGCTPFCLSPAELFAFSEAALVNWTIRFEALGVGVKAGLDARHQGTIGVIENETALTNELLKIEFESHRSWLLSIFFAEHILPAMMLMTEQMTVVALQQVQGIGMMLDAKHQLETQRLFQQLQAQAHKDYHPSEGLCTFGTTARALAASSQSADFARTVLSERLMQRQRRAGEVSSGLEPGADKAGRIQQLRETYCDPNDNANELGRKLNSNDPFCLSTDRTRRNKDIDFTRTVDTRKTLDLDLIPGKIINNAVTPPAPSADEEDVMALSTYLYGHDLPNYLSINNLLNDPASFLDLRSVMAKRSVAQNSFVTLAGMKAQGPELQEDDKTYSYIHSILQTMGVEEPKDIETLIGERPSYYAQMELLTKTLYQNPDFYTNLYDKPVNVDRKKVAMQAFRLMQDRDIFESMLRSEMMLSLILEMELIQEQSRLENEGS